VLSDLEKRLNQVIAKGTFKSRSAWMKAAGVSSGYFSSLKRGIREGKRSGVGLDVLERLSRAAAVDLEWLAYGKGSMHAEGALRPVVEPLPGPYSAVLQAIARIEADELRIALSDFYAPRLHDAEAKSTVEEFLTRRWGPRARTSKAWAAQIERAYERRKRLYGGSP
jgi:hypothetical protein